MKISIIGTGYVGLVSGACFSEYGFDVTCVDNNADKVASLDRGEIPIFEPGLEALVAHNKQAGRLSFTSDIAAAVAGCDAVFIAVGTPERSEDGNADLSFLWQAVDEIADNLTAGTVVVTKSTVVVGTSAKIQAKIAAKRPELDFSMASNPEFLREGSALEDFMRPNRVVIGVHDERGREVMEHIYRPLSVRDAPLMFTSLQDAELIKYAANGFLAMKISFINEIADLCEKVSGNVQDVARGIGLDNRIGPKFLHAGPGYGGSCFPKDTKALAAMGRDHGSPIQLIEKVIEINDKRKPQMAERVLAGVGDPKGKVAAVLGIAFKPNTDDIRDAPSLTIIPLLQEAGLKIRASDPEAIDNAKAELPGVEWFENEYEAAEGADVLVILTEWNAYRGLDLERIKQHMRSPVIVDLRNIYPPGELAGTGFSYSSIGRPTLEQ
ncbi:MAG: UDP-glucose/GDP-mannose dehydrogenase family protein [Hyphomicrobiales bacterium]|nr:UDP-glucose/GDP-mannose dehydrogenase family protein [Hyphomicrobiales bacterium]